MSRARSILAAAMIFLYGCSSGSDGERVVVRLVDATFNDPAPSGTASPQVGSYALDGVATPVRGLYRASIDDDMRYTFPRTARQLIHRDAAFSLPADPEAEIAIDLPPAYAGCERLVAEIGMTVASRGWFERRTATMHHGFGSCRHGDKPRFVAVVPVPEGLRGHVVDLWVSVGPVQDDALRQRRFTIGRVPNGARLRFSYGVEAPAWWPDTPAAVFRVRAEGEGAPLFEARLDPGRVVGDRHWFDASVNLDGFAGRALTLVLETEPAGVTSEPTLPVWGDPVLLAAAPRSASPPRNLLLVSIDTLRARSVSAYGNTRETTPFFDRLAREGALFEHAVVQAPLTPESHMSFFTSLYPREHGVTALRLSDPLHYQTLAEMLRVAGYSTGAVTEDGMLVAGVGFERGFDRFRENKSPDLLTPEGHVERTFADAVAWMDQHRREPFFLFVHTYQVHDPYTPPPAYRDMFARADAHGPDEARDLYEAEIRYVDDQLAHLWSEMVRLGLAETTVVVITSDHGEQFGEHGALLHGTDLYDETIEVPLLMRAPGLVPGGLRIAEPVMSLDVLPTVLDLLGVAPSPQAHGRSLVPAFGVDPARSTLLAELRSRPIYAEAWGTARSLADGHSSDKDWQPPAFAQRTGRRKVIWRPHAGTDAGGAFELYDLDADPAEQHALNEQIGTVARGELETYGRAAIAVFSSETPITPDPRTAAKLRALGYAD